MLLSGQPEASAFERGPGCFDHLFLDAFELVLRALSITFYQPNHPHLPMRAKLILHPSAS